MPWLHTHGSNDRGYVETWIEHSHVTVHQEELAAGVRGFDHVEVSGTTVASVAVVVYTATPPYYRAASQVNLPFLAAQLSLSTVLDSRTPVRILPSSRSPSLNNPDFILNFTDLPPPSA